MNVFSNMMTWAARTQRKQAAEGADVFGIEFGRIELTEHGQEASIGLLMFGESVAAGIERSQPKPLEPRNLDQLLLTVGPQVWGNALPHAQPFLLESDGQTWHCPTWPIRAD